MAASLWTSAGNTSADMMNVFLDKNRFLLASACVLRQHEECLWAGFEWQQTYTRICACCSAGRPRMARYTSSIAEPSWGSMYCQDCASQHPALHTPAQLSELTCMTLNWMAIAETEATKESRVSNARRSKTFGTRDSNILCFLFGQMIQNFDSYGAKIRNKICRKSRVHHHPLGPRQRSKNGSFLNNRRENLAQNEDS